MIVVQAFYRPTNDYSTSQSRRCTPKAGKGLAACSRGKTTKDDERTRTLVPILYEDVLFTSAGWILWITSTMSALPIFNFSPINKSRYVNGDQMDGNGGPELTPISSMTVNIYQHPVSGFVATLSPKMSLFRNPFLLKWVSLKRTKNELQDEPSAGLSNRNIEIEIKPPLPCLRGCPYYH